MKQNNTPWLFSVTNFNTFVIKVEEGKKIAKIFDLDNPATSFYVEILGEVIPCESTFGIVDSNKKLVSIVDLETYLKKLEKQNYQAVILQLHDNQDKILLLSAFT